MPDPFAEKEEVTTTPTPTPKKHSPAMVVLGTLATLAVVIAIAIVTIESRDTIWAAIKALFS